MKKNILLIVSISIFFVRCSNQGISEDEYSLRSTNRIISLEIPFDIKNISMCLQYFETNDGQQYLFYLGDDSENKILIYDLDSLKIHNKIQMLHEGPLGIGNLKSLFVHNLDTIFLTTGQMNRLFLVNWNGEFKQSISIKEFTNGDLSDPYNYISHFLYFQNGMICHNKKVYTSVHMPLIVNPRKLNSFKTTLEIDLQTKVQKLLQMSFPKICDKKGKPLYLYLSILFVKNKFIYSFINSHNCIVTKDHSHIETKLVRSRFIKKDFKMPKFNSGNVVEISKVILEHPSYLNFLYDPYRDVIYRFCYPGITVTTDDNLMNLNEFKPIFSVMILDTELNLLGETLMPENTYNMNMAFVGKEGLYLSTNHYLNKDFNGDSLKFEIFNIVSYEP